jgi:hypothetical protein
MQATKIGHSLKGLAITPPVIGRITIGRVIERNGKRLPEKDDQFTITTQVQDKDGWRLHPADETLRQAVGGKLRTIPVRLLFNDPSLNLRSAYTMFDRQKGRPLCIGDGERCQRVTVEGMKSLPCPNPDLCELAEEGHCKPYGRLNVLIGDDDATGTFIFRTTGFNSIRTLSARLAYLSAVSGNLLSCLPLELKLRGKSTAQSFGNQIFYVDLVIRSGLTLEAAIQQARELDAARRAGGFDQAALEQAAKLGFEQGVFEDDAEDVAAVVEEFFPIIDTGMGAPIQPVPSAGLPAMATTTLSAKLGARQASTGVPGGKSAGRQLS